VIALVLAISILVSWFVDRKSDGHDDEQRPALIDRAP
jgi:hypothetical protein